METGLILKALDQLRPNWTPQQKLDWLTKQTSTLEWELWGFLFGLVERRLASDKQFAEGKK